MRWSKSVSRLSIAVFPLFSCWFPAGFHPHAAGHV